MIYKVQLERGKYSNGAKYRYYKIFRKPFKFFPFWDFVQDAYGEANLREKIEDLHSNPRYEGTLDQIFEQVKNFETKSTGATPTR